MSRDKILTAIRNHKPESTALQDIDLDQFRDSKNILTEFEKRASLAGAYVHKVLKSEMQDYLDTLYPNNQNVFSNVEGIKTNYNLNEIVKAHELQDLELAVIEGLFGVSENGAIWMSDDQIELRVLPFITNKLILVLSQKNIVENMHDAYSFLSGKPKSYGVFISGPSKTADIEQSLVIGAHGAVRLDIFLINEE